MCHFRTQAAARPFRAALTIVALKPGLQLQPPQDIPAPGQAQVQLPGLELTQLPLEQQTRCRHFLWRAGMAWSAWPPSDSTPPCVLRFSSWVHRACTCFLAPADTYKACAHRSTHPWRPA